MTAAKDQIFDVAIVSAFGRSDLLAAELKTRGIEVVLVDVSAALGRRALPDLEGPFPIVRPTPLFPAHLEWLMSHSFEEVPGGFCLWLENGPWEFRGRLAQFYAEQKPASIYRKYFSDIKPPTGRGSMSWVDFPYDDRWLIEFAHSFCSNELRPSTEAHLVGESVPLLHTIQVPLFTVENIQTSQAELRATGVQWALAESIKAVTIDRGRLATVELDDGSVIQARQFVWGLSSEETYSISRSAGAALYPAGVLNADWAWRRFQVHSPKHSMENTVPPYVILIQDLHFPWAYENLVVLKRRKVGLSDLWVRLPAESSRKMEQLKKFSLRLEELLKIKFRGLQHEIEPFWDEGPPLYPVFEPEQLRQLEKSLSKSGITNVFFEGPEHSRRMDWGGRCQAQTAIMTKLQLLRQQQQEMKRNDDIQIHAP